VLVYFLIYLIIQGINKQALRHNMQLIKTRITTVYIREDGVLVLDILPNEVFSKTDAEHVIAAAGELGKGKKLRNLILVGEHSIADIEAIKLSCSQEGCIYKLADAFVISSLPQKLIANFYMRVVKPFVPTRFFTKREDAEKWLSEIAVEKEVSV
jgi:hypothetical protein